MTAIDKTNTQQVDSLPVKKKEIKHSCANCSIFAK